MADMASRPMDGTSHTSGRTVAIVQARMGSTRLPGKVLKPLCGEPMLWRIVERLRPVSLIDEIVIATTTEPQDEPIIRFARERGVACFAGHPTDVLDRYYHAACRFGAGTVLRITADCPFIEPRLIAKAIEIFRTSQVVDGCRVWPEYVYVNSVSSFPDGLDTEVFSFDALSEAWQLATDPVEREHATTYITRRPERFVIVGLDYERDVSHLRLTVDTATDLTLAEAIYKRLYTADKPFTLEDVLALLEREPSLIARHERLALDLDAAYVSRLAARRRQVERERLHIAG